MLSTLARYSGWYLCGTGILHCAIGIFQGWSILAEMHNLYWWNSAANEVGLIFPRIAIMWFLISGLSWLLLGYLMQCWIRHTQSFVPPAIGWGILLMGGVVAIIMPASGAWLFLPQALIILLASNASNTVGASNV